MRGPTQNLGPIGSAVLTFIVHKMTSKETDEVNIKMKKLLELSAELLFIRSFFYIYFLH